MNILQDFKSDILAAHSPNHIILENCDGPVLCSITGTGVNIGFTRYPIDGEVKFDFSEVTKIIVQSSRTPSYSDGFDYSGNDTESLNSYIVDFDDSVNAPLTFAVKVVNGALQVGDVTTMDDLVGELLHFYECSDLSLGAESTIEETKSTTTDSGQLQVGIAFTAPITGVLSNVTISLNQVVASDSVPLDIWIYDGNNYPTSAVWTNPGDYIYYGTQSVGSDADVTDGFIHDLTLNVVSGQSYTIVVAVPYIYGQSIKHAEGALPVATGYVQYYQSLASYAAVIKNTLTFSESTYIPNTPTLQVFEGYPMDRSTLQSGSISRTLVSDGILVYGSSCTYDVVEGCGGVYLKWLNTLGGYDYWLFEDEYSEVLSSNSIGNIENTFDDWTTAESRVHDLGRKVDRTKKIKTKADKKHQRHIEGVLMSPEVYLYTAEAGSGDIDWVKVIPKNGSYNTLRNKFNTIQIAMDIVLPETYTQRL
jgi:hypothetical protein